MNENLDTTLELTPETKFFLAAYQLRWQRAAYQKLIGHEWGITDGQK